MTAQKHYGEDGADEDERDDDVKMAISLLIIFPKFGVGNPRAPFQPVCHTYVQSPACSNARKQRTPKMLDNATQKYLVHLPFGENLLASIFSSTLLHT